MTGIFIAIGICVAGAIQIAYILFKALSERLSRRRGRITVGVMYVRWNSYWKRWQCFYMDGYPAEEFKTLEEAIDHCERGQLKKVY